MVLYGKNPHILKEEPVRITMFLKWFSVFSLMAALAGCGCDGERMSSCNGPGDCPGGQTCIDHRCVPNPDADADTAETFDPLPDPDLPDREDLNPEIPDNVELIPCSPEGFCQNDSRCVGGECLPWGPGEFDDECVRSAVPGPIRPQLQCSWDGPPADDPVPTYSHVLHTPLVADLHISLAPDTPPRPVIIFISDASYEEGVPRICQAAGTLRIIDGATCREIGAATDEADRLNAPVTPAVGDIDGDTVPEIVAAAAAGGVIAFKWNETAGAPVRLWRSHLPDGSDDLHGSTDCLWGGITLSDLDDDGLPEVILDGAVWSSEGERLATVPGWAGYGWGVPAPVADVDGDTAPELVAGEGLWQWDTATRSFVQDPLWAGPGSRGFSALADFGEFPGAAGDGPGRPEVVLSGNNVIAVQSIGGTPIASITAPSTGGGPPTVADYDNDGLPEIGAAFADHYVVFDPGDSRVLWQQASQDHSSRRTGSSVFDFNGDGQAEVVYGDECYVRIYDGLTGDVLFSQARFSSTWEENPIVADVDDDYAAEIVMPMSGPCNPTYCPPWDPLFKGLQCDVAADCPGGDCNEGYCRCATDDDCGFTYGCTDPLPDTPGTGQVCRARHLDCQPGLRVYRDARDHWASSRSIWNQHAYFVTNVNEDGTIPRTSDAEENWLAPGLNNFRQNVQGELTDIPGPDFTVGNLQAVCEGESTRIVAEVCNRGGALIDSGVVVIFRQEGGEELCRLATPEPVPPGMCMEVDCVAPVKAEGVFEAVADPDGAIEECIEDNNGADGTAHCLL
jgi:hypothetical protein